MERYLVAKETKESSPTATGCGCSVELMTIFSPCLDTPQIDAMSEKPCEAMEEEKKRRPCTANGIAVETRGFPFERPLAYVSFLLRHGIVCAKASTSIG